MCCAHQHRAEEKNTVRLVSCTAEELVVSATIFRNGDNENRAQQSHSLCDPNHIVHFVRQAHAICRIGATLKRLIVDR